MLGTFRSGGRKELVRSLKTPDERLARTRLHTELVAMEAGFAHRCSKLAAIPGRPDRQALQVLSPEMLDGMADSWLRSMLHDDEARRQAGMSDYELDELGGELSSTRA